MIPREFCQNKTALQKKFPIKKILPDQANIKRKLNKLVLETKYTIA